MSDLNDFFKNGGSYGPQLQQLEQQMAQLSAVFVGQYVEMPARAGDANAALVAPLGTLLSRSAYPALWAWAQTQTGLVVDDATWLAARTASPIASCALYSSGDGSTTFRIPDMGQGGFSRFTRDASESDLDGGFTGQIEDHSHATTNLVNISQSGIYASDNLLPWSAAKLGDLGVTTGQQRGLVGTDDGTVGDNWLVAFTSPTTYNNTGETHPKGDYKRLYIYTGQGLSYLPNPTPDWLAQQTTNTNNISALQAEVSKPKQFMFARGGDVTNFTGPQKFYFHETLNQGITYDNVTRDFTVAEAGVYEVIHTVFATAVGSTPKRVMLSKNRNTAPSAGDNSTYFAQIYINPIDAEYGPAAVHGMVRCNAGDTIQSWATEGQFYLGSTGNIDWFNQITIKKVD